MMMKTKMIKRNDFAALLREMRLFGQAVEVGTAEAYFSHALLDNWPGTLTQIDPYRILTAPGFSGHGEATDAGQEARYQRVLKAAGRYDGRCQVMRATSEEAAPRFEDGSLDLAYLDANHIAEEIKKDLALWFPKVKSGGVFAGHDDLDGMVGGVSYGVKTAVREFAAPLGLKVHSTQESDFPSWFLFKP